MEAEARSDGPTKRIISVHAYGEVYCPPDIIKFRISVSSSKETVEAAQTSVKRRTDYILQVLHNNGLKDDKNIRCSTDINKGENCSVQCDISVETDSLSGCEKVRNILIEKMDSSVQFTPITLHHSTDTKDLKRQEAFKKAVSNAKSKAQCISQTVGVQLGPALEVVEVSQDTFQGSDSGNNDTEVVESDLEQTLANVHQKYDSLTLRYRSQVSATFEVQTPRTCNHKKCKNH